MAWVSKSLRICSSSRSETRQAAPALSFPLHLEELRREPEVGRTLVSAMIWTAPRLSSTQNDRCSHQPEREPGPLLMLPTVLATRRLHLLGIHPGLSVVDAESQSIGRLAECDCQGVRPVGVYLETVGFTYGTLPRAYEGSPGVPA